MRGRFLSVVGIALVTAIGLPVSALAQTSSAPMTSWGAPDLQGVWDFRSLTPMQRPTDLAGKEVFSEEEAAVFSEEVIRRESRDLADADTEARETGRVVPYNDFWFDWGTTVTTDRTSLIVDPPDGRVPVLTPSAKRRLAARRGIGTATRSRRAAGSTSSARRCDASWGSIRAHP